MIRLAQSETYYPSYQEGHSGVTAVACQICRLSDGLWLDWDDSTFKNSGWTDKDIGLVEDDDGMWLYTTGWAIPNTNNTYRVQWEVTDGTGTYYQEGPMIIVNDDVFGTAGISAAVADAVWDEAQADHVAAGSFGVTASELAEILADTGTTLQGELDAIQAAVIDNAAGVDIAADIAAVKAETAAILADTSVLNTRVVLTGTASAGSSTTITLTGGVATAGYYDGTICVITAGTGIGQSRTILSYAASTVATVTRDWTVAPSSDSQFIVVGADWPAILEAGTAQAGGAATITFDAGASATSSVYIGNHVMITAGTGMGQTRLISAYNGSTKVATITPVWTTNPDSTSVYQILPMARVDISKIAGTLQTAGDLAALITTLDTVADTILVDTADMQPRVATIETDTTTDIPALIAALPDAAAINAEVLDVLSTDTFAQPGDEAPAATQTLVKMLAYLYKQWRNKTETTATKIHLYDDAGTNKDQTSTISDDATTFTKGEFAAGD